MIHREKYFLGGLIAVMMALGLTACGEQSAATVVENPTSLQAHFVKIASYESYDIVYNAATRVMYTQSYGMYNRGTFTLLVNDDGSPMIWKG